MNNENLEKLRGTYQDDLLDPEKIPENPFELFNAWLESALKSDCVEPNAFVLSTIDHGRPRSRVVLLKGIDDDKFIFYTNYRSAKGLEVENAHYVSMNFWWGSIGKQIRIEGKIEKVSEEVSDAYFHKRPRGSQLGAIASPQSQPITAKELQDLFDKAVTDYEKVEVIPRPKHWGGYAITPDYMEFWHGRVNRLHDRVSYQLKNEKWELKRLAP